MADASSMRARLLSGGYSPIPCTGKVPALKAWQAHLLTNPEEIALWRKLYPQAINTGILTRLNPVVDVDLLNEAAAEAVEDLARARFEERGIFLTRIGRFPKRAFLLRTDVPFPKMVRNVISKAGAAEKIEVLADGQQMVAFGEHPDTHRPYLWHGGEPGVIPYGDLPLVTADELAAFLDAAVAMLVKDFGYSAAAERPKATNGAAGGAHGPDDWAYLTNSIITAQDVHDSTRNLASKYATAGMAAGTIVNILNGLLGICLTTAVMDTKRRHEIEARLTEVGRLVDSAILKYGPATKAPDPTELPDITYDGDLNVKDQRSYLVRRLMVLQGTTILAGLSGTGKTTICVDLAASLVTGMPFAGLEVMTTGLVLMFLGEGHADFRAAWKTVKEKKIAPWFAQQGEPMPERLAFGVVDDPPMLTDPGAGAKLIAIVRKAEADTGKKVVLCGFDNFTDLTALDPRGNQTFQTANAMKPLRELQQQCACACLLVDHTGKDAEKGVRDSSVKTGKADLILITDTKMGERKGCLKIAKSRSGLGRGEYDYEIEVHTRPGEDGLDDTEVSIRWYSGEERVQGRMQKAPNSVGLRRLLECLDLALASDAAMHLILGPTERLTMSGRSDGAAPTSVRAVDQELVWVEFLKRQPHTLQDDEDETRTAGGVPDAEGTAPAVRENRRKNSARKLWRRAVGHGQVSHLIGIISRQNSSLMWRVQP